MPNSEVPRVELNGDGTTINLVVNVYGFKVGAPVEISGSVTQQNGAVASFYSVQPVPDPPSPGKASVVPLGPVAAVGLNAFDTGDPVTVVARATQVWITTLGKDVSSGASESHVLTTSTTPLKAAWNGNGAQWAVAWDGQDKPAAW